MTNIKTYSFKANVHKSGHSNVITIPSYFFKAGLIDPKKEYEIFIKEVDNNGIL